MIDINNPDISQCRSFEASIAGISSKVYFVNPGATITKVKSNDKDIWQAERGGKFIYCIAFLKGNSVPMLLLSLSYDAEMENLKVEGTLTTFTLDISSPKETEEFEVLNYVRYGAQTYIYVPKDTNDIDFVRDKDIDIWKAAEGTGEMFSL
ncbi:hypothetical protein BEWA_046030 [Theileria equi strain WA]|uniref:Uncharacterized protein n=1 Tax=Theileria equi strain WA TaxID=1537102 RepID=L1LA58_THEEQ|nr:hypothetical protein BEWA_046030 [Theileria equi strain WA]EKX72139.1 hypothetical protein BEWA_046030 [Theileria equi strain WA]|eukprot:XP_004831591.1 hypothetical protein BEWA_046030 [Theileria equi strain WA]